MKTMNRAAEACNNRPLFVDEIHRELDVRIRKLFSRSGLAMLGLVTVGGGQGRAGNRAIDRNLAPAAATDRTDLFTLCRANPLRRPLFTNRAAHAHSSCHRSR